VSSLVPLHLTAGRFTGARARPSQEFLALVRLTLGCAGRWRFKRRLPSHITSRNAVASTLRNWRPAGLAGRGFLASQPVSVPLAVVFVPIAGKDISLAVEGERPPSRSGSSSRRRPARVVPAQGAGTPAWDKFGGRGRTRPTPGGCPPSAVLPTVLPVHAVVGTGDEPSRRMGRARPATGPTSGRSRTEL
jgi:hypothetical protein